MPFCTGHHWVKASKVFHVTKLLSYLYRKCQSIPIIYYYPVNIYLFEVSNKNTRKRCEIVSKLTIKTPERRRR